MLSVDTMWQICIWSLVLHCYWMQILQHVLLDLPGILFFTTYTLLVLFWAEIYHQVSYSDAYFTQLECIYTRLWSGMMYIWLCSSLWWKRFEIDSGGFVVFQARSLPTDSLRPTFLMTNALIYFIQVCFWKLNSLIWWNEGSFSEFRTVVKRELIVTWKIHSILAISSSQLIYSI